MKKSIAMTVTVSLALVLLVGCKSKPRGCNTCQAPCPPPCGAPNLGMQGSVIADPAVPPGQFPVADAPADVEADLDAANVQLGREQDRRQDVERRLIEAQERIDELKADVARRDVAPPAMLVARTPVAAAPLPRTAGARPLNSSNVT